MNMKIRGDHKYILFEIITISCLFANILHTHQVIMHFSRWYHSIYPTSHLFFLLFEGFSIYFISFLYPKRREILLCILFFITTLVLWINVGYSRYFDTYLPLSLYTEFNNLNGLLPNIKDAIELSDIFFLVSSTIVITAYTFFGKKHKSRYAYLLPCFLAFILGIAFVEHYKNVKKDHDHLAEHFKELNDQRTIWDTMADRRRMMENTMPKTSVSYYGIGLTLFLNAVEHLFRTERFHFTEKEKDSINKYMYPSEYPLPKDTTKNLIFILVESLSSFPINKSIGGVELTPNINKLLSEAYYNPNMESQALLGESSDGQFIYLTGLLPLKNGVTINEIKSQQISTFVSLAKEQIPDLYSQMTIPTEKDAWSQEAMCKKYGINKLFSKENYPSKVEEDWLTDKQLFEFVTETDKNLRPPFISFILTSSMHSPYIKYYEDYHINYPEDFSPELRHYLNNVHYMDKHLGIYLESLKSYSWYNGCTIIITADHKPNGPKLNVSNEELFASLPLIIFHPSVGLRGISDTSPIRQSSIFPFILDSHHLSPKWKGIGQSIFMPDSTRNSSYENYRKKFEQKISDYLIGKQYLN